MLVQPAPTVRATLSSVRDHLRTHYRRLGQTSRRLRFMSEPSASALDHTAERATPDLLLEVERDGAVRGLLEAYGTGQGHAEVALSVEDDYQGLGLGRELFKKGLLLLAERGFRFADFMCRQDNVVVLHLIRNAGGQVRFRDGEAFAEVDLHRGLDRDRALSGQNAALHDARLGS